MKTYTNLSQALKEREKVQVLDLRDQGLTEIPVGIFQLTSLTELHLADNQIEVIPSEIFQLTSLTQLRLADNQIEVIPPGIGQLTSLTQLRLAGNQIEVIPPEIFQLTSLTQLYLAGNQIEVIPPELGQLTSLTELGLGGNQIKVIPTEIGRLTNLTQLYLYENQIEVIPTEIGQLNNLTLLSLSNNQIEVIPAEMGQLTSLTQLGLGRNQIEVIPTEIGRLTNLTQLYLYENQIEVIPTEIGRLTSLTVFNLAGNRIEVPPPELGQLTSLTVLNLAGNQIQIIPPEIGQLTHLAQLGLGRNRIEEVPPEVGQLNLTQLGLEGNRIEVIPPEIGQLTSLTVLNLAGNQIQIIPPEVGRLTNLEELNLGSNLITSLLSEIGNLINLTVLNLKHNKLINLPDEINKLFKLQSLNLYQNRLQKFPAQVTKLSTLRQLHLDYNQIRFIPATIKNLIKLEQLWLGGNSLRQLPTELGQLRSLTELHLGRNIIRQVPSELGNLKNLVSLNLSYNRLTDIPSPILDLRQLETLNLEGNVRSDIVTDFGKLLTYREQIEQAVERAEEANQVKGQFLSQMSHEIRTPMNGIIGSLTLLNPKQLTSVQREDVRRALSSAEHLRGVINEILDFSRLEAGQMSYSIQPFDLSSACRQVVDQLSSLAKAKGLYLQLQLSPDLWSVREGDQQKLRQILINLIGNAIKFTQQGGVTVSVATLDTEQVRFDIIDTGIGIAEDQRERLFRSFTQAEEGTTRRYGGTGLGLAISREFVITMGGQIGVESQLEVGSTFWFELLLPPTETELAVEALPMETPVETGLSGVRVLVVDDDQVNRVVAARHLVQMGCQTEEAVNGREAVDMFRPDRYDLILMDLHMPQMDGYEASRQIRLIEQTAGKAAHVLIVALTASEGEEVKERCRQAGMDSYLGKPFQAAKLMAEMERLKPDFQPVEERQILADQVPIAKLESIPLFEPDGLIEIGDRDFLQEMVDLAIETTELRLIELRAAIEAEDWLQTREVSHQLKSPMGTCGAKRMTAIATRMKEQAEGDGPSRVVETYRQSVEIWYKTRSAMQDYLEKT